MANGFYDYGMEELLQASIDLTSDPIKAILIDTNDYTVDLANHQGVDDIPAAAQVAEVSLASVTVTDGAFDAADFTFSSVTGDQCEAVVIYYTNEGATPVTALLAYIDEADSGLPVTPDGTDINVTVGAELVNFLGSGGELTYLEFTYSGSEDTWVVPDGVTKIEVLLVGAGGGAGSAADTAYGGGDVQMGPIVTTPGETLYINIGEVGGTQGAGGSTTFGGGGAGGNGGTPGSSSGGDGGGATDIRQGGNGSGNRFAVAGGGGGWGGNGAVAEGGNAAYTASAGANGAATGGGGGTQGAAGSGGAGGAGGAAGAAGSGGTGGAGGAEVRGGGGGGGGYYGGGGGGGHTGAIGAGGGGGSSLQPAGWTGLTNKNNLGNGYAFITWKA